MRKAASGFGLVFLAGIGGLLLASAKATPSVGLVAGVFLVVAVVVFFGVGTRELAMFTVGLLVFTITWNGIRLGGGSSSTSTASGGALGDATAVLAALGVLSYTITQKRPLPLPPWILLAGLGCLLAFIVGIIFPPSVTLIGRSTLAGATLAAQGGVTGQISQIGTASDALTLIEYEIALVVLPVLIAAVASSPRRCRLLMDWWVAGAVINALVGLLGVVGINVASSAAAVQNRSAGLTIHPNYLALTCVISLPLAMLWFGRSRRWTVAAIAAVAILIGGVFASGSRAGIVAALVAVVIVVAAIPRLRRGLRYTVPIAGMALVIILAFTKTGQQLLNQIRLGGSSDTAGSNYQRSLVANVAVSQIKVRPLEGVGWSLIISAHDIYLELLESAGIIGMASFLLFIGGLGAALRRALSGPLRDEAIVCAIAVLAWLINGAFDNQVADKYLYVIPGLLIAIGRTTWLLQTRAAPAAERPAGEPSLPPQPAPQALAGVGVGAP